MKQLAIISGKGGTGKTSVTASFAALAGRSVIVDADVDAADMFMLLKPKLEKREDFIAGEVARIDPKLCDRGKRCEPYCRYNAIIFDPDGDFRIDPVACEGCGVCARMCHTKAIVMEPRHCGEWYISNTPYGPLAHARLGIGGENSGKLVTLLRQEAKELAEKENYDLVIIDGPPGIGCAVMAAVTGVDVLTAITEPTVSGKHDLERVAGLADHFGIKMTAVINKTDINPEMASQIRDICNSRDIEILAEIPYDEEVVKSIISGAPLVEVSKGPAAVSISKAWETLAERLKNGGGKG